jgi:hypothetical protein
MSINQAVIFTKPVHHLGIDLDPDRLDRLAREYFESKGFAFVLSRRVSGAELAAHEIIRKHYQMYSTASYGDVGITSEGMAVFEECFGREWDDEVEGGRIMGNPQLLESKGIDAHELFGLWNTAEVKRIQAGVLMGWLESLDCYCINAFYPAMESNFYHQDTRIDYYVVEFDPAQVSWLQFRKEVLGATNAAKAAPQSFRGRLYAEYKVDFPGRDNFVHGSAGPFEGMIERSIHETDFDLATNPVGHYLAGKGVTLEALKGWKAQQTNAGLGALFDATEEKNTDEIFPILDAAAW